MRDDGFCEDGKRDAVVGVKVYNVAELCFDFEDCARCSLPCGRNSNVFAKNDLREEPIGNGAGYFFVRCCIDDAGFEGR